MHKVALELISCEKTVLKLAKLSDTSQVIINRKDKDIEVLKISLNKENERKKNWRNGSFLLVFTVAVIEFVQYSIKKLK